MPYNFVNSTNLTTFVNFKSFIIVTKVSTKHYMTKYISFFRCISPIQRPHYIPSSYTYQFFEKISFVSFVGLRIAKHTPSPHLFYNIVTWMQF